MSQKEYKFKLLKDWKEYKKGKIFNCEGGLIRGISSGDGEQINFDNKEWFKLQP